MNLINKDMVVNLLFKAATLSRFLLLLVLISVGGLQPGVSHAQSAAKGCENAFTGAVFFDNNRDGHYEAGETYLPGEIQLIDQQGKTVQTIESADGFFRIADMPCDTYQVIHNRLVVGAVLIDEVMGQELKAFPKATTIFFPLLSA